MGLDQNWMIKTPDDFDHPYESIAYHRKFNALEGFMANIWHRDHEDEFNCCYLHITNEILDELEATVKDGKLVPTSGFFFGKTEMDEYYKAEVKELLEEIIPKVRKLLAQDKIIYYTSWW